MQFRGRKSNSNCGGKTREIFSLLGRRVTSQNALRESCQAQLLRSGVKLMVVFMLSGKA